MKDLATHDRPREKLERGGPQALGDNELLAVLIGHGTSHVTALAVANRLLIAANGVHGLTRHRGWRRAGRSGRDRGVMAGVNSAGGRSRCRPRQAR
jgi:hypothetical protein